MPFELQVALTFALVILPSILDWLRERRPDDALLMRITRYRLVVACIIGIATVSLTLIIPYVMQPYPSEHFYLMWHHPEDGWAVSERDNSLYDWHVGETVKRIDLPSPPEEWQEDLGLRLIYASFSGAPVIMENAFGYPQLPILLSPMPGYTDDKNLYSTGIEWLHPWNPDEDHNPPVVWRNGNVNPFQILLTREAK